MSLLLDSHVLEWAFHDDPRLSAPARSAIAREHSGSLFISDVTLIELARHVAAGNIPVAGDALVWLNAAAAQVTTLPITPEIAWRAAAIDWSHKRRPHKDPADRLIVATAIVHNLPLATKDGKIHTLARRIGIRVVW